MRKPARRVAVLTSASRARIAAALARCIEAKPRPERPVKSARRTR